MKLRTEVILLALLMQGCTPGSDEPANAMAAAAATAAPALEAVFTLQDVQSGKVDIRVAADAETTALWRTRTFRLLERALLPERRPMTEEQLQTLLRKVALDPGAPLQLPPYIAPMVVAISAGTPKAELGPAGMLLLAKNGKFQPRCSAVLARSDTVLTAAHCLDEAGESAAWKVYIPFEGIRDVEETSTARFCDSGNADCSIEIDDLAALKLSLPYQFAPLAQEGAAAATAVNASATILGFGVDNEIVWDNGILREGTVNLLACGLCDDAAIDDDRRLCFAFAPSAPDATGLTPSVHGNLKGDSGGPMLAGASIVSLIGVASTNDSCRLPGLKEGRYVNVTSATYESWLESVICAPPCLPTDSSDLFDGTVVTSGKYVDRPAPVGAMDSDSHEFAVGAWPKKLIIAMNHETLGFDDPPAPFGDLEIEMLGGLAESAVCERHWGAEVCTVDGPQPGAHELRVNRVIGDPLYQLTVVVIRCPTAECWAEFQSDGN